MYEFNQDYLQKIPTRIREWMVRFPPWAIYLLPQGDNCVYIGRVVGIAECIADSNIHMIVVYYHHGTHTRLIPCDSTTHEKIICPDPQIPTLNTYKRLYGKYHPVESDWCLAMAHIEGYHEFPYIPSSIVQN